MLFAALPNDRRNRKETSQKNPQIYFCEHMNKGMNFDGSSQAARKYVYLTIAC